MHVNKENKSTNSTSKVIFHSIITHEKVSHLTALCKISHGFLSCINEDLLFERSMHVNKENKTQEISHLWNFIWVLYSRTIDREGQAMSFEDTKKVKRDGVVEEKRKERRKGCALVTREFLSLPKK